MIQVEEELELEFDKTSEFDKSMEFDKSIEFEQDAPIAVIKSRRGRKSKKELMETLNLLNVEKEKPQKEKKDKELKCKKTKEIKEINKCNAVGKKKEDDELNNLVEQEEREEEGEGEEQEQEQEQSGTKVFKKRGRKPKGGKIIQQSIATDEQTDEKQNIILHLKCSMADLENDDSLEKDALDAYNTHIYNDLMNNYKNLDEPKMASYNGGDDTFDGDDDMTDADKNNKESMKEIWKKIKQLECNLHMDNVPKKSACFWDTCDFDNPPVYIPKYFLNGIYHVYGCFCCPECAVAYLNKEHIDRSTKAERYQLIHDVYSKVYEYKKPIKEASDPRYLLDKFLGNLTIKEYRNLLRAGTLYLVIDKPLTKVYPELHEDTEDYILNNKIIPSNTSTYQIRGKNGKKKPNKSSILSENFGIN